MASKIRGDGSAAPVFVVAMTSNAGVEGSADVDFSVELSGISCEIPVRLGRILSQSVTSSTLAFIMRRAVRCSPERSFL